jgi:hypothetical protein
MALLIVFLLGFAANASAAVRYSYKNKTNFTEATLSSTQGCIVSIAEIQAYDTSSVVYVHLYRINTCTQIYDFDAYGNGTPAQMTVNKDNASLQATITVLDLISQTPSTVQINLVWTDNGVDYKNKTNVRDRDAAGNISSSKEKIKSQESTVTGSITDLSHSYSVNTGTGFFGQENVSYTAIMR